MLRIPDNSPRRIEEIGAEHIGNIQKIAQMNINLKVDDPSNLLIFSNREEKNNDERIFTLDQTNLWTNNIMGFVGMNDTEVTIHSKFACGEEDYFLHYMLQKVFSIDIFDLKHSSTNENIFDFLLYLFPYFLKKALRQGIYKEYQRREYNNANIKGPVNISRHIRYNLPFAGKIAYSAREHSYDNKLTQLIRHTIEHIATHRYAQNILSSDAETKDSVDKIIRATPSFEKNRRTSIMNKNVRPVIHPYFSEYQGLQKICLQILRYDRLKYGQEKDKIYGLLFDGAWLWEEYTNTILKDCGFKHPRNDLRKGGIHLFGNPPKYKVYPDFWKEGFIVDAKYKRLEDGNIRSKDMHQLISYMYIKKAGLGGFIYPVEKGSESTLGKLIGTLSGYGGEVRRWGILIPRESQNFKSFCDEMYEREVAVRKSIAEHDGVLNESLGTRFK